jgi:hypothetical protein
MKKLIAIPVFFSLVLFSFGTVWAASQTPPSAPVTVVNTTANPVPVNVNGSVTGSVSISNTPNVSVVNTPSVRNLDDPGRNPYQRSFSLQIDPGKSNVRSSGLDPGIPANTRLAIDHVNILGELPVGQHLIGVEIWASVNQTAVANFIGTTFRGTSPSGVVFFGPFDIFSGDSGPGLFVDPGENNRISLDAYRDATDGPAHVYVQIFGHLVSVP